MKQKLLLMLISTILQMLTPQLLKEFADKVLDFCEEKVLGSKSKLDDRLILPICNNIRTTFDIPDDD